MTKVIETEGIEKAVISSWESWDGDVSYVTFGGVVLQPSVYSYLEAEGFDLTLELFVDIFLEKSTTTVSAYDALSEKPVWERTFNLNVSVDFNS